MTEINSPSTVNSSVKTWTQQIEPNGDIPPIKGLTMVSAKVTQIL